MVQPRPPGATQVDVKVGEWFISPSVGRVRAGEVHFLVKNVGPADPLVLVIIKDDRAPEQRPVTEGRVPEDRVNLIGDIEAVAPNTQASGVFDLQPGNYLLICNIAETKDGG